MKKEFNKKRNTGSSKKIKKCPECGSERLITTEKYTYCRRCYLNITKSLNRKTKERKELKNGFKR